MSWKNLFSGQTAPVIMYIRNEDKRFHVFVANRIAAIRETLEVSQWRHIPRVQNPADDVSRGLRMEQLLTKDRWLKGPQFLVKDEDEWPLTKLDLNIAHGDPEVKRETLVNSIVMNDQNPTCQLIQYFSDWTRLEVAVAWFLKFKSFLVKLTSHRKGLMNEGRADARAVVQEVEKWKATGCGKGLTVEDMREAETAIIRFTQQQTYQREIEALSSGSEVKRESSVYKLDPILQDGLMRVGGRLRKASMPESVKHPVILPKNQHVSTLILRDIHYQLGHAGRNHLLSNLRRKYWIINANAAARKIMSSCSTCRRQRGKLMEQKMADLPPERVTPDLPPFSNVGVDYFGPVEVRRGRSLVKRYGVLFTCMASRAVHLEVAYSLDTDSCINALRRFVCRRGQVMHMRSDNGTNFIGAEKVLKEAIAGLDNTKIQRAFLQQGIKWSFNPPAASNHGGVWERVIGITRRILTSVLREQTVDDEGFHTVLCEVEAIVNDRPITKLSDDPCDLEALTPNHLLTMKCKPVLPVGLVDDTDCYSKRRWKQVQYICNLFWKRWIREYLPLLQERHKWNKKRPNLAPGDIVLIADSTAPRSSWLLGKIEETFMDKKGFVSSALVKTKTNTLERPITKLCLLQTAQ